MTPIEKYFFHTALRAIHKAVAFNSAGHWYIVETTNNHLTEHWSRR